MFEGEFPFCIFETVEKTLIKKVEPSGLEQKEKQKQGESMLMVLLSFSVYQDFLGLIKTWKYMIWILFYSWLTFRWGLDRRGQAMLVDKTEIEIPEK